MSEFKSLLAFGAFLSELNTHLGRHESGALDKVGALVEQSAKEAIGTYEFGWPQLAESTQEDRARRGYPPNEPLLVTGEMRDSIRHAVEGHTVEIGSDNDKALYHEMGTSKAPPRPFLVPAAQKNKENIIGLIGGSFHSKLIGGGEST